MKKQSLLKGVFILGIAGIIAKFLGLFFRWPIIMLIGDEGVGYYQMSYPLYTFFIAVASGVPVAISKMVSEKNAVGDREGVLQVLNRALILMLIIGGGFTIILSLMAKNLITFFRWDDKAYYSLLGISIAPIFISIMSVFRGFFQGLQNMNPTAVSQIIEQIGRVIVGVGLAYLFLPKGIEYSAGGAAFGAAAGGILGGAYLIYTYAKVRKSYFDRKIRGDSVILGKLISIAIPISLGATVGTIMSLLDSFLVPQKLLEAGFTYKEATILYGQLTGKAFVLINIPLTLSMALSVSLVPIIAEAYILNRKKEVINKVESVIRISTVISLPSFFGLFFLPQAVLELLFPGHADGYVILKYLSIAIPFIILAQVNTAMLQGIGNYLRPVINLAIACILKVCITFILVPIPDINIYGAVIGTIVGYITASLLNFHYLKKALNISINLYDVIIKPAYAATLMIILVVFIYRYGYNITYNSRISCVLAIVVGGLFYCMLIVLFGIFKYGYIKKKIFKR